MTNGIFKFTLEQTKEDCAMLDRCPEKWKLNWSDQGTDQEMEGTVVTIKRRSQNRRIVEVGREL